MARLKQFEGEVVAKSRAGTGLAFNIDGDDVWFNAKNEDQIPEGVSKGDVVAFEYDETNKGGRTFKNIKGDVEIVDKGEAPKSSGRSGGYQKKAASGGGGGRSAGPDNRDRQIVRQNALTQANKLVETFPELVEVEEGPEGVAEQVIELAKVFEGYVFS